MLGEKPFSSPQLSASRSEAHRISFLLNRDDSESIESLDSSSASRTEDEGVPRAVSTDSTDLRFQLRNADLSVRETDFFDDHTGTASVGSTDFLEFWTGSELEGLLTAQHSINLFHAIQPSASRNTLNYSDRDKMHQVLRTFPKNLARYTQSLMRQRHDGPSCWISWGNIARISQDISVCLNRDIAVLVAQLVLILRDSECCAQFLACRGSNAQLLLDLLQDVLDSDGFSTVRPLLSKALLRLSRASGLHPTCLPLSGLQKVGHQVAAGGFGDIWRGSVGGQSVSVKIMRLFQESDVKAVLKKFAREALIWRQLCHPNLLPFSGLYYLENRLCLVSPWMENGNILDFFRKDPHGVDRLSVILDVALGLKYLHENHVIHGDLKAINILVTPSYKACLADFGLSSIADATNSRFPHSTASVRGGTARYQAPELILTGCVNHFGSDVYAFACVCYEILTGKVPFHEIWNDAVVMLKVVAGQRPSRPISCSGTTQLDSLWELVVACWKEESNTRPSIAQIVERLVGPSIQATTSESTTDWDENFSSRFRRSLLVHPLLPSVTQIEHRIFGEEVAQGKNLVSSRSAQAYRDGTQFAKNAFPSIRRPTRKIANLTDLSRLGMAA
ncbi:kinase-like domain-containing protein [Mycena latifolia]|nr:kinase-like domain-containing protein [Mycena latifolia]